MWSRRAVDCSGPYQLLCKSRCEQLCYSLDDSEQPRSNEWVSTAVLCELQWVYHDTTVTLPIWYRSKTTSMVSSSWVLRCATDWNRPYVKEECDAVPFCWHERLAVSDRVSWVSEWMTMGDDVIRVNEWGEWLSEWHTLNSHSNIPANSHHTTNYDATGVGTSVLRTDGG